jgi:hypothetical protein
MKKKKRVVTLSYGHGGLHHWTSKLVLYLPPNFYYFYLWVRLGLHRGIKERFEIPPLQHPIQLPSCLENDTLK